MLLCAVCGEQMIILYSMFYNGLSKLILYSILLLDFSHHISPSVLFILLTKWWFFFFVYSKCVYFLWRICETSIFLQQNSNMVTYSFAMGFIFDSKNSLQIECCILKSYNISYFNSRDKIAERSYKREGILVSSTEKYFIT